MVLVSVSDSLMKRPVESTDQALAFSYIVKNDHIGTWPSSAGRIRRWCARGRRSWWWCGGASSWGGTTW